MQFRKYTKENFIIAIATSNSIREALNKLNVKSSGGNYSVAKKYIKILKLDISHMSGQGWNKNKTFGPKRPIEDYLNNKYEISSHSLRLRLLKEKFFDHKCSSCNLTVWLGNKIPLELHHIDGNNKNNNLSNLQLLCPNCHSTTDNYRGKNIKPKI